MKRTLLITFLLLFSVAQAQFVQPTNGTAGSPIGYRVDPVTGVAGTGHKGLDIEADMGEDVVAAAEGTVRYMSDPTGYGEYIYIEHDNGLVTLYGHLSKRTAPEDQRVQAGQKIGEVGSTGKSTGPHLHFEITEGFLGPSYAPDGVSWDEAAGLSRGQALGAGRPLSLDAAGLPGGEGGQDAGLPGGEGEQDVAGLPETEATQNKDTRGPCLDPLTCATRDITEGAAGRAPSNANQDDLGALDVEDTGSGVIDLDESSGTLGTVIPKPEEWINATTALMDYHNLADNLNRVAMALLFLFFVWSLVNITYYYQSDQYLSLFGRLIIASGLIFGAPVIQKQTLTLWTGVYNTMSIDVVKPATDKLEKEMNDLIPSLYKFSAVAVTLKIANSISTDNVPGGKLIADGAALSGNLAKSIYGVMVLMGSLYGVYLLVVYTSAMTVIVAGALLPILAAFLMLPGSSSWFNRWLSMVMLAFITIVAFPFIYSVAIEVGVVGPTRGVNDALAEVITQLDSLNLVNGGAVFSAIRTLIIQWLFGLVFLAIGVLASIHLMQQLPGLLQGFIGGATGRAANAASGAALGGVLGAGLASGASAGAAPSLMKKNPDGPDKPNIPSNTSPRLAAGNNQPSSGSSSGGGESSRRGHPALSKDNGGGKSGSVEVDSNSGRVRFN